VAGVHAAMVAVGPVLPTVTAVAFVMGVVVAVTVCVGVFTARMSSVVHGSLTAP